MVLYFFFLCIILGVGVCDSWSRIIFFVKCLGIYFLSFLNSCFYIFVYLNCNKLVDFMKRKY